MAYTFAGIDHVQLPAPAGCEEEVRRFYAVLLGWKEIPKPEKLQKRGGVWFQCGAHEVHLGVQQPFVPAVKAHPAFRVNNISALRQHLAQHQIPVTGDGDRDEEGISRFYVNDPFGNRIEFLERL